MLTNAFFFFWKNAVHIASTLGASSPNHRLPDPASLLPPVITALSISFIGLTATHYPLKNQNNSNKCSAFTSFALLHLFFTSNSTVFMTGGGARIFLAPGRGLP